MWYQTTFRLPPFRRGFHLITHLVEQNCAELSQFKVGLAHVFIQHTSASLSLNENADPTVRTDFESHFNKMVPENAPYYRHTYEGPDDMPAHIKAALLGSSVSLPITDGRFNMGTWQGIYLCEHRNRASGRILTVTLQGNTGR
ncbi:secondary thiamine-phosphate synthase enzyme YjbQ [Anaerolineales bacterium HSG6]|nr:secondary thiamine-phosphate synthase enzyme YjbQ [Anaerolineales bacterium HSG6]MDM8531104.1 secondary thiamine-phosphate synthase enzyme YjbQ [Anaerolineales bacterium HSG25]